MNAESLREYCLSFDGVTDKMAFTHATSVYDRNLLAFYVKEKWFCFFNVDVFDFCTLKCDPAESPLLQEKYEGISPGYHMNKKHWISIQFNKDVPDAVLKDLLKKSYDLVVATLTKTEKQDLEEDVHENQ
ncbi:MmcQ/YjbR family DNA-binding protein [Mucilaginibacter polytrichastri]|uniref:MmcQ/YjbR family DNA-binding protein n=1 Tax=Mucilaginibacter polytrichastri TaxID=1302689 RepID=UPI0008EAA749|nr:MmcQ/YjbR family DNA-binding protein [Mucilaginibacter polytrichastri]SFS58780.1 Predicted DNA-binding protein, MmcQ/YjbR family [Mucilaginibacter polytrichastri]